MEIEHQQKIKNHNPVYFSRNEYLELINGSQHD